MYTINTVGEYVFDAPVSQAALLAVAETIISEKFYRQGKISVPSDASEFLIAKLSSKDHEVFSVLFLDNQHCIIAFEEMFIGTIDSAPVFPREVAKRCLVLNAAAVIFAHNHPSGSVRTSAADVGITRALVSALKLIEVRVLDHIIVAGMHTTSMASAGLM